MNNPLDFSEKTKLADVGTALDASHADSLNHVLDVVEEATEDGLFLLNDGKGNIRGFTIRILGKVPLEEESAH